MNERRIHQIFEISLVLKGAHALIECAGGLVLAFVSTSAITRLVNALTQEELLEDPNDFVATHLLSAAQNFNVSTQRFYAFYLLSHGVIKAFLVIGADGLRYFRHRIDLARIPAGPLSAVAEH